MSYAATNQCYSASSPAPAFHGEAKRVGEIEQAAARLASLAQTLREAADRLEHKLAAALRPSPPATNAACTPVPCQATALGSGLADTARSIQDTIERLGDTCDRLEL